MYNNLLEYIDHTNNPKIDLTISVIDEDVDGPEMFKITMTCRDTVDRFGYTKKYTLFSNTKPSIFGFIDKNYSDDDLYSMLDHMHYELEQSLNITQNGEIL